jgi:branched-chain amino acid transport system ATP-binding protein
MALNVAKHAYVLQTGQIIKEGNARVLLDDPDVKKAYLGG